MSQKKKGSRTERELFHMFYDAGCMPLRSAGSGSTPLPSCDLVVSCKNRHLAIECKSLKGNKKYLDEESISQLRIFAEKFNAVPILAIRFDREDWYFLDLTTIDSLEKTKSSFVISLEYAKSMGMSFQQLIANKDFPQK